MKRASFLAILAVTTALVSASLAHAQAQSSSLPQNAQLVAGAATVKQTSATQTTITQSSQSAILNWQSFSIGKGNTVDVVQPGATSVLLNRVTGQAPSTIAGQLNANGQVFLINPNGIVIGKTGVVQASGFVASTLDISDSDFLAGRLNFKATGPSAAVVHAGTIRITPGGYAALLGGSVADTGEIVAPLGKVAIGAGSAATLDLSGDGFLQVALTGTTNATGVALLSATDARNAVRQTVNMDGVTESASATGQDGHIVLSGRIDISDATGAGGNVKVLGTTLDLAGGVINAGHAQVETSGDTVDFTGIKVSAGNWLVDPTSLTIDSAAAATISSNLATTDITLQTTASGASGPGVQSSGAGDIIVNSAISWSSAHQLTLDSYHGVDIDALITVAGAGGKLKLIFNDVNGTGSGSNSSGLSSGDLDFGLTDAGFAGHISFTAGVGSSQALTINGQPYTLIYSLTQFDAIDGISAVDGSNLGTASDTSGNYALAQPLDASSAIYTDALITGSFNGNFEGLGNTITGLTIHNTTSRSGVGLFAQCFCTIRDIGLVDDNVSGPDSVGALVGYQLGGMIDRTYASGTVSGGAVVGGLVGDISDTLENSFSTGTVTDMSPVAFPSSLITANTDFGGLVGLVAGEVHTSHSSATVSDADGGTGARYFGGLLGELRGDITNSYATGAVTSTGLAPKDFGGLVGYQSYGSVNVSYATGMVSSTGNAPGGNNPSDFGGLVGEVNYGTLSGDYATGEVLSTNGGAAANFGGLAGYSWGDITDSFAMGDVIGGDEVGGLVGSNQATTGFNGSIQSSYATGWVLGSGMHIGGLVGANGPTSSVSNSYYDAGTTGRPLGTQADGSQGVSTATLQSVLPSGFLSSTWSTGAGLYPYLTWQYPIGTQAITGFADTAAGTAAAGAALDFYKNGVQLNTGTVYSGANGYYYTLVPANTVVYKTPIGTTMTLAGATGISGIAFTDTPAVTGSVVNNRTIMAGRLYGWQSQSTWSSLLAEMTTTFGADRFASLETTSAFNHTDIYALLPTFTIDTAQDVTGVFKVTEENHTGTLVDSAPITVEPGGTVMLISNGPLVIDAPAAVKGAGLADLRYDNWQLTMGGTVDPSAFTFGAGGGLTFLTPTGAAATSDQGGTLKINTTPYTLVYSMSQLDAIDGYNGATGGKLAVVYGAGMGGDYALAEDLDSTGTTYINALIGTYSGDFSGIFDGLGHSIANLTFNYQANVGNETIGLFGSLSGQVRNIDFTGLALMVTSDPLITPADVGGLVGYDSGGIYHVAVSGEVDGANADYSNVGGMVGYSDHATVIDASMSGTVEGGGIDNIGGLLGGGTYTTVKGASSTGSITGQGSSNVGGLVGSLGAFSSISMSFSNAGVEEDDGASAYMGGLVGSNDGTIDRSYATGNLYAFTASAMGGLVGINNVDSGSGSSGVISNSYATGFVESISVDTDIGGFVGHNLASVSNSYSTGVVLTQHIAHVPPNVGGFAGVDTGTISNSYWNTDTSGLSSSAGGSGLTTAQLQSGTLPAGFDPAIWTAAAGQNPKLENVAGQ